MRAETPLFVTFCDTTLVIPMLLKCEESNQFSKISLSFCPEIALHIKYHFIKSSNTLTNFYYTISVTKYTTLCFKKLAPFFF